MNITLAPGWTAEAILACDYWGFKQHSSMTPKDLGLGSIVKRRQARRREAVDLPRGRWDWYRCQSPERNAYRATGKAVPPLACSPFAVHIAVDPRHGFIRGERLEQTGKFFIAVMLQGKFNVVESEMWNAYSAKYAGEAYEVVAEVGLTGRHKDEYGFYVPPKWDQVRDKLVRMRRAERQAANESA